MARKRKNKTAWWVAVPMWTGIAALVGWGLWQAAEFRRSMIGEVHAKAPEEVAPAETTINAIPENVVPVGIDETVNAQVAVTGDEWAAATTPASSSAADGGGTAGVNEVAVTTAPADRRSVSVDEWLARGATALDAGRIVEGRSALNAALALMGNDSRADHLREELAGLNAGVFLGSSVIVEDPAARFVEIAPGDSFLKLGKTYGIPASLIEAMNPGVNPRNLKPLTGVKIVQGPFHLRVFKHAGRIDLYARDLYVQSFAGQVEEGNYLPVGTYRVSAGSKIQVGAKLWVGIEGATDGGREPLEGWLYGTAGPRSAKGLDRVSGVKIADTELVQLYNVLVEGRSLVRVEP